jgi:hypothetical protein
LNLLNGRYIQLVASEKSWPDAYADAASRTFEGRRGRLAIIQSLDDWRFISPLLGGATWLGASDEGTEGFWSWVTPDWSQPFFRASLVQCFAYCSWAAGEPNNLGGGEHYLAAGVGPAREWFDYPGSAKLPYVVEYAE